jgi:hypothetical protein
MNEDDKIIKVQRVSKYNINRVVEKGKMSVGDSFNDVLGRVLDEYEKMKKGL